MKAFITGGNKRARNGANSRMRVVSLLLAAWLLSDHGLAAADGIEADFEAGVVAASRNDVRIPGAGGTALSLVDDLSAPLTPVFRLRAGYRFAERHLITVLYAPLRLAATGVLARDVTFAGQTYPAGGSLLGVYRFDSYRLTYRYSFIRDVFVECADGRVPPAVTSVELEKGPQAISIENEETDAFGPIRLSPARRARANFAEGVF